VNLVPLAAIKGGRAVELAWHTEEGKEVKGVDFNSIYIYIMMCMGNISTLQLAWGITLQQLRNVAVAFYQGNQGHELGVHPLTNQL